jgi:hypothetical protein
LLEQAQLFLTKIGGDDIKKKISKWRTILVPGMNSRVCVASQGLGPAQVFSINKDNSRACPKLKFWNGNYTLWM